jgi:hypothetical protein
MEKTFETASNAPSSKQEIYAQDNQRQEENQKRAAQGEPTVGGSAGRAQVGSKDPKGEPSCRVAR